MSKTKLLTTAQVCKTLGFKQPRLSKMVKAGCPVARTGKAKSGRKKYFFRLRDVQNWIGGNTRTGSLQHDTAAGVRFQTPGDPVGDEAVLPGDSGSGDSGATWASALDRARKAERIAFNHWVLCIGAEQKGEGNANATKAANHVYLQTLDALRKAETDAAKIQQSRRESMLRTEHERIFFEAFGKVSNALRNFAKKYASQVAGKRKVLDCHEILNKGVDECMSHAERELNKIRENEK